MSKNTDRSMHAFLLPRLRVPGSGPSIPVIPGTLEGVVTLELPEQEAVVLTPDDVARLGLTYDAAWAISLDNLRARSSPGRWQEVATVPYMEIYLPGNGDAASRTLLVAELVDTPLAGVLLSIPTRHQLLAVPLREFEAMHAVEVLVGATRYAVENSSEPLSDQLFWYDGATLHLVPVDHRSDNAQVRPPPALLAAVERLATMSLLASAGEA